ncbi:hypothetical protein AB0M48_30275 [Lentzea sp. NPDC051208]|uniref:hypothetical protein n=1 Tax=Lentzea sp. NPDC051208 TaxID=3154642 RepID=UPI00343718C2
MRTPTSASPRLRLRVSVMFRVSRMWCQVVRDPASSIVRLVAADAGTVRDVIHDFNARSLPALDPRLGF